MGWADQARKMDAQVRDRLGDSILYSTDGGATFAPLKGFVVRPEPAADQLQGLDPLPQPTRIKLSKVLVAKISAAHRLQAPDDLEGTWRPRVTKNITSGRDWLFEIERV